MNKRHILLVIVLILIVAAIVYLESQKAGPPSGIVAVPAAPTAPPTNGSSTAPPVNAATTQTTAGISAELLKKATLYVRAPELAGISGYINTPAGTTLAGLRGKVVLVDFWTYSCINCLRTLPFLKEWYSKYKDQGFVIVGVHTPEFDFEKVYDNVKNFVTKEGITYPVVQDNDYQTWQAFHNNYWPRDYLIDADGFIRSDHIGEGGYDETEREIQNLLGENGMMNKTVSISNLPDLTPTVQLTPEIYTGYSFALQRGQNIGNQGGYIPEITTSYTMPSTLSDDTVYLGGRWKSQSDALVAEEDGATLELRYVANNVNIVAESSTPMEIHVLEDGVPALAGGDVGINGTVRINEPRLYTVLNDGYGRHTLTIKAASGFTLHSFTFG